jgi:hypothetical protein
VRIDCRYLSLLASPRTAPPLSKFFEKKRKHIDLAPFLIFTDSMVLFAPHAAILIKEEGQDGGILFTDWQ